MGSTVTENVTVGQSLEEEREHQGAADQQAKVQRKMVSLKGNAITVVKLGTRSQSVGAEESLQDRAATTSPRARATAARALLRAPVPPTRFLTGIC